MKLTTEEQGILNGSQGPVMAKIMRTIVDYGEIFGADRLVPLTHRTHIVTSFGLNGLDAVFNMWDELIKAGIKTQQPFTADPRPYDFDAVNYNEKVKESLLSIYKNQDRYEKQLLALGLQDKDSFSCACYLPETGNIPKEGDILSWAESSAVNFANSVLGARSNRNSGVIELFGAIINRAPNFGLLTDEGRKATWLVEVQTSSLPNPQLLGSALGMKVVGDVPYVTGLDKFLGNTITDQVRDYLKEFGTATASNGAVGLYYAENITPEAKKLGRSVLAEKYQTYVITDAVLQNTYKNYPILWKDQSATPELCVIGCPHLSLSQIHSTVNIIANALEKAGQKKILAATQTVMVSAPKVINEFKKDQAAYRKMQDIGLALSHACPVMHMSCPVASNIPAMTNSNKLRTYSSARYYKVHDLLPKIVPGYLGVDPSVDPFNTVASM